MAIRDGTGPPDHPSFHLKNRPVLHSFPDLHACTDAPHSPRPGDGVTIVGSRASERVMATVALGTRGG